MIKYEGADIDFSLKGKTAIITGGAAGIGYATAKFFHEKGVNIVLVDMNPKVEEIPKSIGPNCFGVRGDICDAEFPRKAVASGVKMFKRIDILVNNAGTSVLESAENFSADDWNRIINVNLSANFFMAQTVGKYMIDNGVGGCIVNMASQAGVIALDKHVAYCVSKAGIISMTQVLALEWGKYGIRVNAVSPTVVLTDMGRMAWDNPEGDAVKKEMPSGRFAETDEIAACIAFLCSKGAAMITGHNMLIDGGYTIK